MVTDHKDDVSQGPQVTIVTVFGESLVAGVTGHNVHGSQALRVARLTGHSGNGTQGSVAPGSPKRNGHVSQGLRVASIKAHNDHGIQRVTCRKAHAAR